MGLRGGGKRMQPPVLTFESACGPIALSDPVLMPFSGSRCGRQHRWPWQPEPWARAAQEPRQGQALCSDCAQLRRWLGWTMQHAVAMASAELVNGSAQDSSHIGLSDSANPSSQPLTSRSLRSFPLWSLTSPSSLPGGPWLIEWFCSRDLPYLELNWLFLLFCGTREEKEKENASRLGVQSLHYGEHKT